jgi:transcriptional regulator EpsA
MEMSIEAAGATGASGASEDRRAQAIAQVIEAAVDVRRKYQFFVWTQSSFQLLLPHKVVICGLYDRTRKQVRLELVNSIVVPANLQTLLTDGQSPLMQHVVNAWINNRGRPLVVKLEALAGRGLAAASESLQAAGYSQLLVHGVSRPQRASEIESLFVFASPGSGISALQLGSIELLLPHLHSTYLRVQSIEHENTDPRPQPVAARSGYSSASISEREEQVLAWVREGMSNQEIGVQLGISPLTVKNHVQKILRKLGATNRAQAVARAMSMNLLPRLSGEDGTVGR